MDKEINTLKERLKNERHAFDSKTNKMADQIDELRTEVTWESLPRGYMSTGWHGNMVTFLICYQGYILTQLRDSCYHGYMLP